MLSKSDLQSHRQCPRKLWLERHHPELLGLAEQGGKQRLYGHVVGEAARAELGEFIWPPTGEDKAAAAQEARKLLAEAPGRSAVEFPLFHRGLYARADAIVRESDGYVLRETKASSFPLKSDKVTPSKPEEHHLDDVAIQAWVMTESGLPPTRVELNYLDGQWRYPGTGDYSGLFRQFDVTDLIAEKVHQIPAWLEAAERTLAGELPEAFTGRHCGDPFECAFQDHCRAREPKPEDHPIELLPDAPGKSLAKKLREAKGYTSILQPTPDELTGSQSELYRRIQRAHRTGEAIKTAECAQVIGAFAYPRYFFDFEGIDLPVPRWSGVRPYEQIAFQWSCHIETAPGQFVHWEFLDLSGDDPSTKCIEQLHATLDPEGEGPIFVYSATYERSRLVELAGRHPEHAESLGRYVQRLVDLLPIVKAHYYHPQMRGSFSIKKVLPVIAEELAYDRLEGVHEGTGAQDLYIEAALTPATAPERKREIDGQLRAYCRQDTWAMVEVAHFLAGQPRPPRPVEG